MKLTLARHPDIQHEQELPVQQNHRKHREHHLPIAEDPQDFLLDNYSSGFKDRVETLEI